MPTVIVTYDIDHGHSEVKKELKAVRFYDVLSTGNGPKKAPNTTVFIDGVGPADAIRAFDGAVARAGATLRKPINVEKLFSVTIASDWLVRSNASA